MHAFFQSLILGIIQGSTEFLPISSSAHLTFAQEILGFDENRMLLSVFLHLSTLMAVTAFFGRYLADRIRPLFLRDKSARSESLRIIGLVAAACVPTTAVALLMRDHAHRLTHDTGSVSLLLIITGIILLMGRRQEGGLDESHTQWRHALIIGTLQGIAVLPGISRSGITIVAGLLLGMRRRWAFTFSFLLAIPAIAGAGILEIRNSMHTLSPGMLLYAVPGMITAFVFGYYSLKLLKGMVEKSLWLYFSLYCMALGSIFLMAMR